MVWSAMPRIPKSRVNGGTVSAGPLLAPSRKNCTEYGSVPPATLAVLTMLWLFSIVAPFVGDARVALIVFSTVKVLVSEPSTSCAPPASVATA